MQFIIMGESYGYLLGVGVNEELRQNLFLVVQTTDNF